MNLCFIMICVRLCVELWIMREGSLTRCDSSQAESECDDSYCFYFIKHCFLWLLD